MWIFVQKGSAVDFSTVDTQPSFYFLFFRAVPLYTVSALFTQRNVAASSRGH
jgi:hypothetical protein